MWVAGGGDCVSRELVAQRPDRHGEIVAFEGRRPQALHRVAPFGDCLRRLFNRRIQFVFRFRRALRKQVGRGLEPQQHTVEALKQRVVQFPRDAGPFVDAFLEPSLVRACDLTNSHEVGRPQHGEGHSDPEHFEPARLVVRRRDREFQRCTRLVPDAAVVAALHAELIGPRREVGVEGLSPRADVLPVAVATFKFDAELVLFRRDVAQRRVVDLQIANERRQ